MLYWGILFFFVGWGGGGVIMYLTAGSMIAIKVSNSTSTYVAFLKAVFKLHFDETKLVYYIFFVNDHKPYATPISFTFLPFYVLCASMHT